MRIVAVVLLALFLIPVIAVAQEEESGKRWSVAIRIGSFSTSNVCPWICYREKIAGGIELTRYFTNRTAVSFSVDGYSFNIDEVLIAPITATYKFFPWGVGLFEGDRQKSPVIRPWFGGGAGLYLQQYNSWMDPDASVGAHFGGGVMIPMNRFLEFSGEMRYAFTSDFKLMNFMFGVGFRF